MTRVLSHISAIIPARYGSTRLPGKPLIDFHGKPMVQWVYEIASSVFEQVAVATDDRRIEEAVLAFEGNVVMTDSAHLNGTSRVNEAYRKLGWHSDYVVNVQGDEPMLTAQCLMDLANSLEDQTADIGTLISKVEDEKELFGESEVFVVKNKKNQALYFSRAIIPFFHKVPQDQWLQHGSFFKHVGLYAYKPEVLSAVVDLPESFLERAESLEQNRWLEEGYKIKLAETKDVSYSVDTPYDAELVRELMAKKLM